MPKQFKKSTSAKKRNRLQLTDGRVFTGVDPIIDGNDLYTFEQRKRSLKLTNSTRISSNAIKPFLKQLMGSRTVRTQFMGRMINEAMNCRSHHLQLFRHNMYAPTAADDPPAGVSLFNQFSQQVGYGILWKNNVLYPIAKVAFDPLWDGLTSQQPSTQPPGALPVTSTTGPPFRDMYSGETYLAPNNRSDLEDMCWNLNKFKLGTYSPAIQSSQTVYGNEETVVYPTGPSTVPPTAPLFGTIQASNTPLAVLGDVPRRDPNAHAGASRIWLNNYQAEYDARIAIGDGTTTPLGGLPEGQSTPYSYKAVFNYGEVKYEFMNKGRFGSIVEIIVVRFKKTQYVGSPMGMDDPAIVPKKFLKNNFTQAFVNAEIKRQKGVAGTEDYNGGYFSGPPGQTYEPYNRVVNDPDCPFCPETSNLLESDKSMTRVSTKRFAMVSGARRTITIPLPGERFDPAKLSQWNALGATDVQPSGSAGSRISVQPYMCDGFTYGVIVVVNGQRISQDLMANPVYNPANNDAVTHKLPPISSVVGDGYSPFDVQFNCTYSERLSACEYSSPSSYNLTVRGVCPYTNAANVGPLVIGTSASAPNSGYKHNPAIVQAAAEQVRLGPVLAANGRQESPLGNTFNTAGTTYTPTH